MAKTVLLSKDGTTIYPATILDAIIDPNTGRAVNIRDTYTINGQEADESGNFTLSNSDLGAAAAQHSHSISNVTDLQATLNNKSAVDHSHDVVTGIQVDNDVITGNVKISGKGNITVSKVRNNVNISVTPFVADITDKIEDSNQIESPFQVFVGTEAEYEAFKANIESGKRYLVFIRS